SRLDGKFEISVTPKPGQKVTDIDKVVETEIANIINNGVTQRELQRAQNVYKASFLNRLASVLGKAEVLNSYNYFIGNPDYVQQHELPLADFVLLVGSGGTADPTGKTGVANLTAQMLREGTTTRKSLDIADQTSFLGISLFPQASWESSTLSLHTPTAQLDSALALFADVALHPSFPANEFERIKKNRLTELLQLRDQGPAIANLAFPAILYGKAHP